MKYILFSLLIFSATASYCQFSKLGGTWFSIEQDRFAFIGDGSSMFENSDNYHLFFERQTENQDSLKLFLMEDAVIAEKEYSFYIKSITDSLFILKPTSPSAIKLFNNRDQVKFYRDGYLLDKDLVFEKLIYHQTPSGTHYADDMVIQIDSQKNIFYTRNTYDSAKTGNFQGKLTNEGYSELIRILQKSHLKRLTWPPSENYMGEDRQQLILYYNGQRKELTSTTPPVITMDLLMFIAFIEKYSKATKTTQELKFDN